MTIVSTNPENFVFYSFHVVTSFDLFNQFPSSGLFYQRPTKVVFWTNFQRPSQLQLCALGFALSGEHPAIVTKKDSAKPNCTSAVKSRQCKGVIFQPKFKNWSKASSFCFTKNKNSALKPASLSLETVELITAVVVLVLRKSLSHLHKILRKESTKLFFGLLITFFEFNTC